MFDSDDDRSMFADSFSARGRSALRRSTKKNRRTLPCPTCKAPDRLTPADRAQGYQCDEGADREEGNGSVY
jgi:hypothetical protein